jgi:hypothetical protein
VSQLPTAFTVAKASAQGMREHCLEVGPSSAGATWGVDRGTAADWRDRVDPMLPTHFAFVATVLLQKRDHGTSPLLDELLRQINGAGEGRAEDVDGKAMAELADLGAALHEDAKAMQDRHVDLTEAARLLPIFERVSREAAFMTSALRDKLRRQAP